MGLIRCGTQFENSLGVLSTNSTSFKFQLARSSGQSGVDTVESVDTVETMDLHFSNKFRTGRGCGKEKSSAKVYFLVSFTRLSIAFLLVKVRKDDPESVSRTNGTD